MASHDRLRIKCFWRVSLLSHLEWGVGVQDSGRKAAFAGGSVTRAKMAAGPSRGIGTGTLVLALDAP
jgi:hypothetical protein